MRLLLGLGLLLQFTEMFISIFKLRHSFVLKLLGFVIMSSQIKTLNRKSQFILYYHNYLNILGIIILYPG